MSISANQTSNWISPYSKGLLITALGVLIISPDGLLTRIIDADPWTFAFWRGLLSGIAIFVGIFVLNGKNSWARIRQIGWGGLLIALIFGVGGVLFVYAFTTTSIANTLFIVSTQPVFAAVIGWYFLNDRLPMRTIATIGVVLIGVALIAFAGDREMNDLWGNLAALGAALATAINFSLARRFRNVDMVPAVGLGGFVAALSSIFWAVPTSITAAQWPWLLLLGLFVLPVSFALMYVGPRYVPAAEVTLMTLLEAVLGPLFVWWLLRENPGTYTLVGGAIIITALAVNTVVPMIASKPEE